MPTRTEKIARLLNWKIAASSALLLGGRLRSPLKSKPRRTMATVATNPVATAAAATQRAGDAQALVERDAAVRGQHCLNQIQDQP